MIKLGERQDLTIVKQVEFEYIWLLMRMKKRKRYFYPENRCRKAQGREMC